MFSGKKYQFRTFFSSLLIISLMVGIYFLAVPATAYADEPGQQPGIQLNAPEPGQVFEGGSSVRIQGMAEMLSTITVKVKDQDGNEVFTKQVDASGGAFITSFTISKTALTGEYTLTITGEGLEKPYILKFNVQEAAVLSITGNGVNAPCKLTLSQIKNLPEVCHDYSVINTWPAEKWYLGIKGVKLTDILGLAQVKEEAKLITIKGSDGYEETFTIDEFFAPRYYFPGLMEGSSENKVPVPTILSTDKIPRTGMRLIIGQRWVTEQNNLWYVKYVDRIIISTEEPGKWSNVTADPAGGVVKKGASVVLGHEQFDSVKIYYTMDGSEPDGNSAMYNVSASYYQPQLNVPIEITEDTTVKAIAIGTSKRNSDIVTFTYTVSDVQQPGVQLTVPEAGQGFTVGEIVRIQGMIELLSSITVKVNDPTGNEIYTADLDVTGGSFETEFTLTEAAIPGDYTISITSTDLTEQYIRKFRVGSLEDEPIIVDNVKLLSPAGNPVTTVEAGTDYCIQAALKSNTGEAEDAVVIIQVRGGAGVTASGGGYVLGCTTIPAHILPDSPGVTADFTMPSGLNGRAYVDVFVWDGWEAQIQLAKPHQYLTFGID